MERASFMLPVEVGCAYNRCRFCTLFKHLKFRVLPLEEVRAELQRVKGLGGNPKRIFLGDGNPFGLPTERLLQIIDMIHEYFPDCREINMDATVTNISEKSDEELRRLHEEGIQELYLGIESGMDELLRYMKKDHTVEEAYEQIARLKQAGLIYNAHLMLGLAGAGRGLENAERTAEFINRTGPKRIINFTIFHHESAPLYRDVDGVLYVLPSGRERDPSKGAAVIQVEHTGETAYSVDVTVDLLDENGETVTGVECYAFPYEFVEDHWVFTDFRMVY